MLAKKDCGHKFTYTDINVIMDMNVMAVLSFSDFFEVFFSVAE